MGAIDGGGPAGTPARRQKASMGAASISMLSTWPRAPPLQPVQSANHARDQRPRDQRPRAAIAEADARNAAVLVRTARGGTSWTAYPEVRALLEKRMPFFRAVPVRTALRMSVPGIA
eukprot:947646-Rhodomonas_salina.1